MHICCEYNTKWKAYRHRHTYVLRRADHDMSDMVPKKFCTLGLSICTSTWTVQSAPNSIRRTNKSGFHLQFGFIFIYTNKHVCGKWHIIYPWLLNYNSKLSVERNNQSFLCFLWNELCNKSIMAKNTWMNCAIIVCRSVMAKIPLLEQTT